MSQKKAEAIIALALTLRGTSLLFSKLAMRTVGPYTLCGIRFLISFAVVALIFHKHLKGVTKAEIGHSALVGFLYFLCMAFELNGLKTTPSSTTAFLENSSVMIIPFIAAVVYRRLPKAMDILSAVIAMAGIGFLTLGIFFFVDDKTYGKTHKAVNLAHPLAVASCKVIVDGNDVNTVARKSVEVCGKGCNKSFTFTCSHFGNSALMKNDTADNLHGEVLETDNTPRSLTAGGKCFGKNIVKSFSVCKSFFEFGSFCLKLGIGQL